MNAPAPGFTLGPNSYGKSGIRLVHVDRASARHAIRDLTVHTALAGDLDATHYSGDNTGVLPTDTQKNTVYAFARDGVGAIEAFAERLARHFVETVPAVAHARVRIEEHPWTRIGDHSFARGEGGELRTAEVRFDGAASVTAGVRDLLLLNTTDSEFSGFLVDGYTTLPETDDRILATAVTAAWDYAAAPADPDEAFRAARAALLDAFAGTYSLSLQQTLYAVGERILKTVPEAREVRLSLPNRHHYLLDLGPLGRDNPGVVFQAGDLPYGLIEGTVRREAP
ncbi:factor-independent urate hydroxylase [Glycomyces terrestris]|uniref:Uricase n=1 Tax=Glycomyces terrestris TaxID=2493553 RepID=A0A426UU13_9ACTN|nr:urate oxidase [Glycomyces terrestris]RRR97460.1 urate oxidase [Glycomyces terrestris]